VFGRRSLERHVEELAIVLGVPDTPITASGAVMTLPAAAADLRDWIADERDFRSMHGADWLQVIDDFREGLKASGPKLLFGPDRDLAQPASARIKRL
jgi:hypothetical protein